MNRERLGMAVWALGIASVLLFPASRNMRMMAFFVTLLIVAALRMRPWFTVLAVSSLAVWVAGIKDVQFGWTVALMICVGLFAADFAVRYRERFVSALALLSPAFVVAYLVDRAHGFSGVATLDNTVVAGPIFALLSILVVEKSVPAAFAYGYLCVCMESTTGMIALLACYAPMLLRRVPVKWVVLGAASVAVVYVCYIDTTHLGYGQRAQIIGKTLHSSLDAPLLGHGWASFELFGSTQLPRTWDGARYMHAHCDFAQLAYEAGFLALALALAYLARCLVQAYRRGDDVSLGSLLGLTVFTALSFPWHIAPGAAVGLLVLAHHESRGGIADVPA